MKKRSTMARPLGVRGHQKGSQLTSSNKGPKYSPVEGPNESTALLALDIDPRTLSIIPQPFSVRLDIEKLFKSKSEATKAEPHGRPAKVDGNAIEEKVYTPDFLVELTTPVPLVVEIKSNREFERIVESLERRRRVLNNLGYHYLVVQNSEVQHKGLHSNLVNLRDSVRYRSSNDVSQFMDELNNLTASLNTPFSLGEIMGQVSDLTIYLGLISGVISCDLRAGPFGVDTKLCQSYGDLAHLELLNLGQEI